MISDPRFLWETGDWCRCRVNHSIELHLHVTSRGVPDVSSGHLCPFHQMGEPLRSSLAPLYTPGVRIFRVPPS